MVQQHYLDRELRRVRLGRPVPWRDDEGVAARLRRIVVALCALDTRYSVQVTGNGGTSDWN